MLYTRLRGHRAALRPYPTGLGPTVWAGALQPASADRPLVVGTTLGSVLDGLDRQAADRVMVREWAR